MSLWQDVSLWPPQGLNINSSHSKSKCAFWKGAVPFPNASKTHDILLLNGGLTLRSFQMSLSGSIFRRPSLLWVQPFSHNGRDGTAAAQPGSSFALASEYEKRSQLPGGKKALSEILCDSLQMLWVCFCVSAEGRPSAPLLQNWSCSRLCRMSQPLSLSRDRTSDGSVRTSSAKHSSCRKPPTFICNNNTEKERQTFPGWVRNSRHMEEGDAEEPWFTHNWRRFEMDLLKAAVKDAAEGRIWKT